MAISVYSGGGGYCDFCGSRNVCNNGSYISNWNHTETHNNCIICANCVRQIFPQAQSLNQPSNNSMNSLKVLAKKWLNADVRKLIKAGLISDQLEITSRGQAILQQILLEAHTKELLETADEIIAEEAESKK